MDLTRRGWMLGTAAFLMPLGCSGGRPGGALPEGEGDAFARFPGKVALRVINDRPPCLETPWHYFRQDLTPNEAFYVRWHLQAVPAAIDLGAWRLRGCERFARFAIAIGSIAASTVQPPPTARCGLRRGGAHRPPHERNPQPYFAHVL
jgi:hypothetical protein